MVHVTIDLLPQGDDSKRRLLQELLIWNTGGTSEQGEYAACLSHSTTFRGQGFEGRVRAPEERAIWRRARGIPHVRKDAPAQLVANALGAMGLAKSFPDVALRAFVEGWKAAGRGLETAEEQEAFAAAARRVGLV